ARGVAVDALDEHGADGADGVIRLVLGRIHLRVRHRLDHIHDRRRERAERRHLALPRLGVPGVAHQRQDPELAGELGRHERHRRRDHHVRDRGQLLGRGFGRGDEANDRFDRRRKEQHAADDLRHFMQAVLEARGDAEIAAAAADGPEEIRMRRRVGAQQLAVGGDDVRGEQTVDGQPELAAEIADAAAEGDTADADGAGVAEADREAVRAEGGGELGRGESGLGPCDAVLDVDVQSLHRREIEDDPALGGAVTGGAVAAAAHRELEAATAREADDPPDVGRVRGSDDGGGAAIEAAVEQPARGVVLRIAGRDDAKRLLGEERGDRVRALGAGAAHARETDGGAKTHRRGRRYHDVVSDIAVDRGSDLGTQLEARRVELTAYCYRMLGSAFEAEAAVQEAFVRAWRGFDAFEGRSSFRSWLYRIATNVCLDMKGASQRRARPMDLGPARSADTPLGTPLE